MNIKIISWNVNGIRAVENKGFYGWLEEENPDILAMQETRALYDRISPRLKDLSGYFKYWAAADKKGYSGTGLLSRREPVKVYYRLGPGTYVPVEGRVILAEYENFFLFNIYFPNGKRNRERLEYKLNFYEEFLANIDKLKNKKKPVIVCGDFNTAHRGIDLARPKQNVNVSGFLPQERALIDRFIDKGFVDSFRMFDKRPGQYSWWDLKTGARERNVGWRIDYFFVSKNFASSVKTAFIRNSVSGSDHCPVGITARIQPRTG